MTKIDNKIKIFGTIGALIFNVIAIVLIALYGDKMPSYHPYFIFLIIVFILGDIVIAITGTKLPNKYRNFMGTMRQNQKPKDGTEYAGGRDKKALSGNVILFVFLLASTIVLGIIFGGGDGMILMEFATALYFLILIFILIFVGHSYHCPIEKQGVIPKKLTEGFSQNYKKDETNNKK